MLYFKKLAQTRDFLFHEINASELSDTDLLIWNKQKEIISEICTFVFSFEWLSHRKAIDFMKEVVRCNYDYATICERTGRPYMSVRATVSTRSSEAEKLVGVNTLDLLLKKKCVEAYSEFLISSDQKSFETYALKGIQELLPSPEYNSSVVLEDCGTELKFLKAIGVENFKDKIDSLDSEKLKCLLAILGDNGVYMSVYRTKIWQFLLGGLSYKDLMRVLREQS